jgi:hypothetical protein
MLSVMRHEARQVPSWLIFDVGQNFTMENPAPKPAPEKDTTKNVRPQKPQKRASRAGRPVSAPAKFPRHAIDKALRIPKAILEQNAGKECSEEESAKFVGVGYHGPYRVEVSSGIKYGLLTRPSDGRIAVTDRAKQIIRPQSPSDALKGMRDAVMSAPVIQDVYGHYRGENLPDPEFFNNALSDKFGVPLDKVAEFRTVFIESLEAAQLLEDHDGKKRITDVSHDVQQSPSASTDTFKKLEKAVSVRSGDSCFVMMPFAPPLGGYYEKIYKPAIEKAGLTPIRADTEIFGTGKIIDQIWAGINGARVLVAELTKRNPNVFYELGLAHALEKPVVLVSSNEDDVPFDLHHIRVIYYDVTDPFWGSKLVDKIAENILSAIKTPEEAIFKRRPTS